MSILALVVWSAAVAVLPLALLPWIIEGPQAWLSAWQASGLTALLAIAYLAYCATLGGYGLWGRLMSKHSAGMVSPFALLVPLVGMSSSALILGEILSGRQIVGVLLVMTGLVTHVFGGRKLKKADGIIHYGWLVLAMGTLAIFGALGLARFGYSMILPNMQAGLGMDNSQAGLLATTGLAGYLALAIVGGALASRYGVRLIASLGLALAGFGMLFMGLSDNFLTVALWSGFSGLGSGAVNIAIMGLWPAWFSSRRRGLASGIAVSGSSVGLITTGLVVPWIMAVHGEQGWQVSWLVFGIVTLTLAVGSYLIIRNAPAEKGLVPIGQEGTAAATGPGEKANWRQVYFSGKVWSLGIVYIAFGFSYIIFMTFFVKHLVSDAGLTGAAAGKIYMLMGWSSLVSGIIWGMLSDIIGRKKTLIILYLIHGLAFSLFAVGTSPAYFIFSAVLYGVSAWSIPAIMSATCGDLLGPDLAPAALGFITLFFGIGQVLGPVVAGSIADAYGSFSPVFMLTAGAAILGAVSSALLLKTPKECPTSRRAPKKTCRN